MLRLHWPEWIWWLEKIETQTQLNRLRAMGCQRGQGYLFSQPLGRDAATALLTNPWPRASFGALEEQPEAAKKA